MYFLASLNPFPIKLVEKNELATATFNYSEQ